MYVAGAASLCIINFVICLFVRVWYLAVALAVAKPVLKLVSIFKNTQEQLDALLERS